MPNYYEITPANETVTLSKRQAKASFTVRYVGNRNVEARAEPVATDGAAADWLSIDAATRSMGPNQTQSFDVTVTVPPDAEPGDYGLRLDMVSVDNTDEEYDQGPTVRFSVPAAEAPASGGFPLWALILVGVLLLALIGGVIWWLFSGGEAEKTEPRPQDPPAAETRDPSPSEPTPTLAGEDCLTHAPSRLSVESAGGNRFRIAQGRRSLMIFESRSEAQTALRVIRHYNLTSRCFIGRPQPSLSYLKTAEDKLPSGSISGEDCIRLRNPDALRVRERSSNLYQVIDGNSVPYSAPNRAEAERIIKVVQHYDARATCYVGRPDPGMTYIKR